MSYSESDRVIQVCEEVGAEYKIITGDEAKQIYQAVHEKFFSKEHQGWLWDKCLPVVPEKHRGFVYDAWRHIQYLTQGEPVYLMFNNGTDPNVIYFEDSSLISRVLGKAYIQFFVSDKNINYLVFEDKHNVLIGLGEKAIQWIDSHIFDSTYLIGVVRYKSEWLLSNAPIPTWILNYLAYNPELSLRLDPNAANVAKNNLLFVDENNAEEFVKEIRFYETFPSHIRHSIQLGSGSEEDLQLSVAIDFDNQVYINNYTEEPLQGYIPAHWTSYSGSPLRYVPEDIRAIWEEPIPEETAVYNDLTKILIDACESVGANYQLMTDDQAKAIYDAADQKFFTKGRPSKRWGKLGLSLQYITKEGSYSVRRRIHHLTQGEAIYLMFDRYRNSDLFLLEDSSLVGEILDSCPIISSGLFISNISLDYLIFQDSRDRAVFVGEKSIQWAAGQDFYESYIIGAVRHQSSWKIFQAPTASWALNYLLYNPRLSSFIDRNVQEVTQSNLLEVDETNAANFLTALETYEIFPDQIRDFLEEGYDDELSVVIDFDNKTYINTYPEVPLQNYIPSHWTVYQGSPLDYVPDEIRAIWEEPLPAV
jgi:hypothetical protein